MAQMVKNLPAMWETWVQFPGWEDPMEKGTATLSSILAWRIHGQRSLAGYSPWVYKESDMTGQLSIHMVEYTFLTIVQSNPPHY